jgi:hypothetical protein
MANLNTARSSARSAAEGKATTAKPKAMPTPREESANTAQDQAPVAEAPKEIPLLVVCPNPKRANTIAYRHFEMYGKKGELTTHREALGRGVRGKDVSWDSDKNRCHILLGDDAVEFSKLTDRAEQAAFLKKYSGNTIKDSTLIKWGYMDAPVEKPGEETAAEETKAEEKTEA